MDFRPGDVVIRGGSAFVPSARRSAQTMTALGRQPGISVYAGPSGPTALAALAGLPHTELFVSRVKRLPGWAVLERTGRYPHATLWLPGDDWETIEELAGCFRGPRPNPASTAWRTPSRAAAAS